VPDSRQSGLLAHITSLPSAYGIGDLGDAAYAFANRLHQTHQQLWQVLPTGPTGPSGSPYSSRSTFAGNPMLISPTPLLNDGLLTDEDVAPLRDLPTDHVDYPAVLKHKTAALTAAFERFDERTLGAQQADLSRFRLRHADWLADYTLYEALREAHDGASWTEWPAPLAQYEPEAVEEARRVHARTCRKHAYWQYLFFRQWQALHAYCRQRDLQFFGDLPIYVAHDSADVWAHQDLFRLDADGQPTAVAGVPPDYFSPDGQRWNNPLYRWNRMADNDFAWWTRRLRHAFNQVDLLRLDHFRGFDQYWAVPAHADTAVDGHWEDGPGASFFEHLQEALGPLPIVAEDLGEITDSVYKLRDRFDFPGMAVLQFAFETDANNIFLPHNYRPNTVAYTGTHDNNTLRGWWADDTTLKEKRTAHRYLDLDHAPSLVHAAHRMLWASAARRVVLPMQDLLELPSSARMNTPGTAQGNWQWRFSSAALEDDAFKRLSNWTLIYGRATPHNRFAHVDAQESAARAS
jgi:4-alpha-glucanotransferase